MENFQGDIKKWVSLDSQLKNLTDSVKEIRNERNELVDSIFDFVEENNLSTSTIKISDGKLKFSQNKQTSPISLGFLEKCLTDLFHDEAKVHQIMNYIKENREIKMVPDIKRYYNN
jgi:predicted FMN-binding regulatory protein PaiB